MINITVYPVIGGCYLKQIKGTLKEMQEIVGGYIEAVHIPGRVVVVDEEGLCKNKRPNPFLSTICGRPIVGNGFIINEKDWNKC